MMKAVAWVRNAFVYFLIIVTVLGALAGAFQLLSFLLHQMRQHGA